MKRILIAAAAWLIAAPAFAENYNLVCPIAEMGTAQAGGATVAQGFIFSVDQTEMKACLRAGGKCETIDIDVVDDVIRMPNDGLRSIEFNIVTNQIAILSAESTLQAGVCRRAPFQAFPAQ